MDTNELRAVEGKMTGDWVVEADFVGTFYINDDEATVCDALSEEHAAAIVYLRNNALALADEIDRLRAELAAANERVASLRGAISWIEPPFVDDATSHDELKKRVGFCVTDAARAALSTETNDGK